VNLSRISGTLRPTQPQWGAMEARCAKCGVTVVITDVRSAGQSYVMKPGLSLVDLCPIMIEREEAGKPQTDEECPNLAGAIDARIEQFRKEHP
jgi:hypothetical protein